MLLHEFPEGIVTYVMLSRGGLGERRSAVCAFLAASGFSGCPAERLKGLAGIEGRAVAGAR
jgi:hypothetical protein